MASGIVSFGNHGEGFNVERATALIAALPEEVTRNLKAVFNAGADRLVDTLHHALPIDEMDPHPGALRASAHKAPGSTPLSVKVVVDARDAKGRFYAKHVEHGHKTKSGAHIAAKPAFYPAVREEKKRVRREAAAAVRKAVKQTAARVGGG